MPTTTSITTSYAGTAAGKYIAAALLSAPTLDAQAVTIMPNVKFKQVIKKVATDGIIKNATCDFDPTSTITLTERVLQPESFQVNLSLCKSDFRSDWDAISMGYSAFDTLPKSFADFLIAHASEKVAAGMETSIWSGVNATAGEFAGIMTQLTTDASLPAAQEIAGTTITAANVIAELGKIVDACPAALYGKEDLTLYVSNNIYRAYVRALGGFAAAGVGANGYDNKGTNQVLGDLFFDGVKIFMANGLANGTALLSQKSNLYFATGLLNDMNEVKVLDMGEIDGSQNVRVVMRFTADAKYGFAEDLVTYGITNAAN
tara:strand:+ start:9463 stop:10413 length:951 start_codon:yes stop_codon:yes gene_type:complete